MSSTALYASYNSYNALRTIPNNQKLLLNSSKHSVVMSEDRPTTEKHMSYLRQQWPDFGYFMPHLTPR